MAILKSVLQATPYIFMLTMIMVLKNIYVLENK